MGQQNSTTATTTKKPTDAKTANDSNSASTKQNGITTSKKHILRSRIDYIKPPTGSNVARELINSIRDKNATRTLVVDGCGGASRAYSGAEIWQLSAKIATGLMQSPKINLQVGEPLLLMCDHSFRELLVMLASLYAGASIMGTDQSGYTDLRVFCEPTKPRVIIASREQLKNARQLRAEVPGMGGAKIVIIDENARQEMETSGAAATILSHEEIGAVSYVDDLINWREIDEQLIMHRVEHEIDPILHASMLMVTSGSTGRSKVVPWTHEKQLNDIWSIISATKQPIHGEQPNCKPLLPLDESVVLAGDLPIDQGAGVVSMIWCLMIGGKYVLIEAYDEISFWRSVEKFKLSGSIASATFTYRLLRQLKRWLDEDARAAAAAASAPLTNGDVAAISRRPDISSMRLIACTGSRTKSEKLLAELRPIYPHLEVTQFYGATELGFIAMLTTEDASEHPNSVGHLFPGVRAKVVDIETGANLDAEAEGEMLVWSPSLFEKYLPHPDEKLEDLMRDRFDGEGFYRTGDLVHYDHDERFYIHSRLKDTLYLDQDWKTPPYEIESIINKHPLVHSSVVVGVPNLEVEGCVHPKAFIKLKKLEELEASRKLLTNGGAADVDDDNNKQHIEQLVEHLKTGQFKLIEEDIFQFTAKELTHPKHLHGGIRFLDKFPTIGALNKIDKQTLRLMD